LSLTVARYLGKSQEIVEQRSSTRPSCTFPQIYSSLASSFRPPIYELV
jgi:hypothetical protein